MSSAEIEFSPDELDAIGKARQIRVLLQEQLARRTETLLLQLVDDYRGGKHNPDKALGFIAEISGMREQIDECTRTIRGSV